MWIKLLFLLLVTPILAAPSENYDDYGEEDQCRLRTRLLEIALSKPGQNLQRHLDAKIDPLQKYLTQLEGRLATLEENSKKRHEDISKKLQILDEKIIESDKKLNEVLEAVKKLTQQAKNDDKKISALSSSVVSGFEKVSVQAEQSENRSKLVEAEIKASVDKLGDEIKSFSKDTEKNLKELDSAIGKGFKKVLDKIDGHEKTSKERSQNLVTKLDASDLDVKNKLKEGQKLLCDFFPSPNLQKTRQLNLTRLDFGVFYFHPRENTNWKNAKNFCVGHGMNLVTSKTLDKMKNLTDANPHFKEEINEFWVDASDVGQQLGHFVWQSDGTEVDKSLWRSGQPNEFGAGKEAFAYLYTGSKKLHDRGSGHTISFICKLAEKDFSCL